MQSVSSSPLAFVERSMYWQASPRLESWLNVSDQVVCLLQPWIIQGIFPILQSVLHQSIKERRPRVVHWPRRSQWSCPMASRSLMTHACLWPEEPHWTAGFQEWSDYGWPHLSYKIPSASNMRSASRHQPQATLVCKPSLLSSCPADLMHVKRQTRTGSISLMREEK
jgi:hypothetical protein